MFLFVTSEPIFLEAHLEPLCTYVLITAHAYCPSNTHTYRPDEGHLNFTHTCSLNR